MESKHGAGREKRDKSWMEMSARVKRDRIIQ